MAKPKSPKLHLSLFTSFQICRPKKASSMINTSGLSHAPYMHSPLSSKTYDISFPGTPIPPPSTPSKIYPLSRLRTGEKTLFSQDSSDFLEDGTLKVSSSRNQTRKHKSTKEKPKSSTTGRSSSSSRDQSNESESLFSSPPNGGEKAKARRRLKQYGEKEWREGGECDEKKGMEQSFVVVKRSEDPYEDFKRSMSEMIVEKQMFEPRELELLLMSFLSLNSRLHHKVIVEAFTQILKEVFVGHHY